MSRNVFYDLQPEPTESFYRWGKQLEMAQSADRDRVSEDQHTAIAVELATIKAMLGMNTQCIRRVEIRLLGSNEDPESGIIALMARKAEKESRELRDDLHKATARIRSLEDDRLKFWAIAGAVLFILKIFEKPILNFVGVH